MSDRSVSDALRSRARLVVVEAPAGTGKTHQGAEYAREISAGELGGRILILTHTHAARQVFASRTSQTARRVEVRTIDSLVAEIAGAYHGALGLPSDVGAWARREKNGHEQLAEKVAKLAARAPMIRAALASRYPVVICDEHQDANASQHELAMAFHTGGASLRVFADPMQRIFGGRSPKAAEADARRWSDLKSEADRYEELDQPHRWKSGSLALGEWVLRARATLREGGQIDLRGELPEGLRVLVAENQSPRARGGYQLRPEEAKPIRRATERATSLLILAAQNDTVKSLRPFFGRRIPIWEGHVRDALAKLVEELERHHGSAEAVAAATASFVSKVATGLSSSAFGDRLLAEIKDGCSASRRGKPATLQELARIVRDDPSHRGASRMLQRLRSLILSDPAFSDVNVDHHREFAEAAQLETFDDPHEAFAQLSHRRSHIAPTPPSRAISTVHKAKGLECANVVLMPCDALHFPDSTAARALLYVAISRATHSLTLVVSRTNPSPLAVL